MTRTRHGLGEPERGSSWFNERNRQVPSHPIGNRSQSRAAECDYIGPIFIDCGSASGLESYLDRLAEIHVENPCTQHANYGDMVRESVRSNAAVESGNEAGRVNK